MLCIKYHSDQVEGFSVDIMQAGLLSLYILTYTVYIYIHSTLNVYVTYMYLMGKLTTDPKICSKVFFIFIDVHFLCTDRDCLGFCFEIKI